MRLQQQLHLAAHLRARPAVPQPVPDRRRLRVAAGLHHLQGLRADLAARPGHERRSCRHHRRRRSGGLGATGTGGAAGGAATGTGGSATGTGGVSATGGAAGSAAAQAAQRAPADRPAAQRARAARAAQRNVATPHVAWASSVSPAPVSPAVRPESPAAGPERTATCNSNLTCVSGTCTCGDSAQACCDGTTCNTGFQCANGTCSCGGAGPVLLRRRHQVHGIVRLRRPSLRLRDRVRPERRAQERRLHLHQRDPRHEHEWNALPGDEPSRTTGPSPAPSRPTDGTVWCWGSNTYGALGIGDTTIASSTTPLQVSTAVASGSPLTGITAVVGRRLRLHRLRDRRGRRALVLGLRRPSGQLGIGDESNSSFAVPVVADAGATPVTGFKSISPSYYNTCGLKTDNTVWCWGDNYYGAVGNGARLMDSGTDALRRLPHAGDEPGDVRHQHHRQLLELQRLRQHERRERLLLGLQRLGRSRRTVSPPEIRTFPRRS